MTTILLCLIWAWVIVGGACAARGINAELRARTHLYMRILMKME
jgi:hypothetical protein